MIFIGYYRLSLYVYARYYFIEKRAAAGFAVALYGKNVRRAVLQYLGYRPHLGSVAEIKTAPFYIGYKVAAFGNNRVAAVDFDMIYLELVLPLQQIWN